jgi:hypothetical protein
MADAHSLLIDTFTQRINDSELVKHLHEDEAVRLGREAAEAVLGPLLWRDLMGADRLDTTQVARLLGVSRQAVHKKVKIGALLGVPGRGTTWFPAWQFDSQRASVRDVVASLLEAWRSADSSETDAYSVLSWSKTAQPELDGLAPEDWISLQRPPGPVVAAARQAALALAS